MAVTHSQCQRTDSVLPVIPVKGTIAQVPFRFLFLGKPTLLTRMLKINSMASKELWDQNKKTIPPFLWEGVHQLSFSRFSSLYHLNLWILFKKMQHILETSKVTFGRKAHLFIFGFTSVSNCHCLRLQYNAINDAQVTILRQHGHHQISVLQECSLFYLRTSWVLYHSITTPVAQCRDPMTLVQVKTDLELFFFFPFFYWKLRSPVGGAGARKRRGRNS